MDTGWDFNYFGFAMFPNTFEFKRNCQHVGIDCFQIPFVLYFNSNKELVRPPLDKNTQELTKYALFSSIPFEDISFNLFSFCS